MDKMILGRYIALESSIHKLDPRAKIIAMFILVICVFLPSNIYAYIFLGVVIAVSILLAKLKITYILRSMIPMLIMMLFLLVVNIFVVRSGEILFHVFGFDVYANAIYQTLFIVIRLLYMISITSVLTASTKPLDLTLGIEDLLSPLKPIGVPAHVIAMMISIALRFIPTLIEETIRIQKAQASRGVDLENGKFSEKVKAILSLIIPLFISSFQKAEDLAFAMEARGYNPEKMRTRYRQLKMHTRDYVMLVIVVSILVVVVVMNVGIYAL